MPSTPSILVVDDDPELCNVLAELLTDEGFVVRRASDGMAAWAEVLGAPPDVIVSDIAMPRLDGFALARRIAAAAVPIPIILMSGGYVDHARIDSIPLLTKPFGIEPLLAAIAQALAASGQALPEHSRNLVSRT